MFSILSARFHAWVLEFCVPRGVCSSPNFFPLLSSLTTNKSLRIQSSKSTNLSPETCNVECLLFRSPSMPQEKRANQTTPGFASFSKVCTLNALSVQYIQSISIHPFLQVPSINDASLVLNIGWLPQPVTDQQVCTFILFRFHYLYSISILYRSLMNSWNNSMPNKFTYVLQIKYYRNCQRDIFIVEYCYWTWSLKLKNIIAAMGNCGTGSIYSEFLRRS